jgi:type IV pilus assembly protein PilA
MTLRAGFSLIEMMVALGIIAILAAVAVPQFAFYMNRETVTDAVELAEPIRKDVRSFYRTHRSFPVDNEHARVPPPDKLLGNEVTGMEVDEGALHIDFGNKAHDYLQGKTLSLRPITVKGSPESPMSWVCGNSSVPEGMVAHGRNRTDIKPGMLPLNCRKLGEPH